MKQKRKKNWQYSFAFGCKRTRQLWISSFNKMGQLNNRVNAVFDAMCYTELFFPISFFFLFTLALLLQFARAESFGKIVRCTQLSSSVDHKSL